MSREQELAAAEDGLCRCYELTTASIRRIELRGLYRFSQAINAHRSIPGVDLRRSLTRCGARIGKDRTTLIRYAIVALRIKPDEFEALLTVSDEHGWPPTFWDFVEAADLSRAERARFFRARVESRQSGSPDRRLVPETGSQTRTA